MAKVIERKPRPGETFLGGSGAIMPQGLRPSKNKRVNSSAQSPDSGKGMTISQVAEEALQQAGWTEDLPPHIAQGCKKSED